MSLQVCDQPTSEELALDIERHIQSRTGRRVHNLRVEVVAGRVVLRGRAATYYVKQVAQHSVWDVVPGAALENAIEVARAG
jgi:hypothetical protein